MSFPVIIILMLLGGAAGGVINYFLPANTDADGKKIRKIIVCLIMGIGAAVLVPLFLEFAQSKLMDNIHYGRELQKDTCDCGTKAADTVALTITLTDTTKKNTADSAAQKSGSLKAKIPVSNKTAVVGKDCCVPLKNYFLFLGYCFVAAAAGIRFITGIIDSVLKERQIEKQQKDLVKTEKEKEKEKQDKEAAQRAEAEAVKAKEEAEKAKIKMAMNNRKAAEQLETTTLVKTQSSVTESKPALPAIGAVTNMDDPQKGRFGGRAVNNNRHLKAEVKRSLVPGFYNVKIWVESTDPARPLTGEVIFYLHDSFRPSVYPVKPGEFTADGKAMDDEILAYGAFTVGAVTDNGETLLELDLADQPEFPKEFRER